MLISFTKDKKPSSLRQFSDTVNMKVKRFKLFILSASVLVTALVYLGDALFLSLAKPRLLYKHMPSESLAAELEKYPDLPPECQPSENFEFGKCKERRLLCYNNTLLNRTFEELQSAVEYECSHLMSIREFKGGLGNQMFQMASVIGVAAMHGYTPVINNSSYLFDVFKLKNGINFTLSNVMNIEERVCCVFDRSLHYLDHTKNWTIAYYLQSWKYFQGLENMIRNTFIFYEEYTIFADQFLKNISKPGYANIAVHVRRGDFMYKKFRKLGYTVAPARYIERAMTYMTIKYTTVQFIFASNDIEWCEENFKDDNIYFSVFNNTEQDMALLSSCDHAIITTGTYSWWVGWLSGGTTVYYRGYPKPGTYLHKQFTGPNRYDDYYPKHWVGLT